MLRHVLSVTLCLALVSPASSAEDKPAYPVVDGKYVVIERMLVKAGYEQWFEDYWRNTVLPVFAEIDGFEGGVYAGKYCAVNGPRRRDRLW